MTLDRTTAMPSISLRTFFLAGVFLFGLLSVTAVQMIVSPHSALAGSDTYPSPWRPPTTQDTILDTWKEWNRECTSYAAWMLHSVNGYEMPFNDDAVNWGIDASNRGITVNMTPVVGSIYWSSSSDHVAWVESISGSNVTVQDYNDGYPSNPGLYDEHTLSISSASGYIHFKDINKPVGAWDGGTKTLLSIFRPSTSAWIYHTSTGDVTNYYGQSGDIPVPGYYSGSAKPDYALYRPSNETWYYKTQLNATGSQGFGIAGDIPVPGDYDGTGKTTYATFRPSDDTWHWYRGGADISQSFGLPGDIPAPAVWDGGGKTEPGVFRPSDGSWHYLTPTGPVAQGWGLSGDIPVPGYYSGSSKPDFGLFRPSNNTWYWFKQGDTGGNSQGFGLSGDIPVPGYFSGSAKEDFGLLRPSDMTWHWLPQGGSEQIQSFGSTNDLPVVSTLPYPILHSLGLL